jgi:hypothetical protein
LRRGTITVRARVRLDGLATGDAVITTLRDSAGASAAVRFGQLGDFVYYNGETKIHTNVRFRRGVWYRSTVTVDIAHRTYAWQLRSDTGRVLVNLRGIRWRTSQAKAVQDLCLQTSSGRPNLAITFDNIQVTR